MAFRLFVGPESHCSFLPGYAQGRQLSCGATGVESAEVSVAFPFHFQSSWPPHVGLLVLCRCHVVIIFGTEVASDVVNRRGVLRPCSSRLGSALIGHDIGRWEKRPAAISTVMVLFSNFTCMRQIRSTFWVQSNTLNCSCADPTWNHGYESDMRIISAMTVNYDDECKEMICT